MSTLDPELREAFERLLESPPLEVLASGQSPVLLRALDGPVPSALVADRAPAYVTVLHAMVLLGLANSRMKDFYDVAFLADHFDFDGRPLVDAIAATFERRRTPVPEALPLALTDAFAGDEVKRTQWSAFLRRSRLPVADLADVVAGISAFVARPIIAAAEGRSYGLRWRAGGPWREVGT